MILQTLKIDIKIEQYIAITYKYLIKQFNWKNMKTHYSILPSANLALPYFIRYICSFNGTPRGAAYSSTLYYIKYCWSTNVDHR